MKMRSIAIVAAVVGMLNAQVVTQNRPSEADLGGPSGPVVAPRPISPTTAPVTTSMTPGMTTAPMAPSVQRMPTGTMPYGPGYQTMTPEQQAKLAAMQEGMKITEGLVTTGAEIGKGYATTDAELRKARGLAEIEQQKADRIRAQQLEAAQKDQAAKDALKTMIRSETQKDLDAAATAISDKTTQIENLRKLITKAEEKNIKVDEKYNHELETAEANLQAAIEKQSTAVASRRTAVKTLDDSAIDDINLAFQAAVNLTKKIDLSSSISDLTKQLSPARAAARRSSTSR